MLFSSLTFLICFLPILLILYFVIRNRKIKNLILLLFSLVFYAWGEPKYIFLMIITIIICFIFGRIINYFDKKKNNKYKKISLIISIIVILGGLIFFKYWSFLLENISLLFNLDISNKELPLPIGISFYTFQILSYLIDLYRGKIKVQKDIFSLALYVSLFPQLIAGPIVRYETIEYELANRKESLNDFIIGVKRFIIGLSKKVIIANQMAIIADLFFDNNASSMGTSMVWLAVIAYTLQIYFDFSGYSDMAIGLGRMFGFHFLENFNYPYISKSITDFWRRWHISLSSWFRDYIYIPLGGNRCSKFKWLRNIFIVWCLTGFWHGAAWNFILWGLYFAVILIFEKLFLLKKLEKCPKLIRWLYAIIFIMIGWVIFRSNTLMDILLNLKLMFTITPTDWITILAENTQIMVSLVFVIPAIICSGPWIKKFYKKYETTLFGQMFSNGVFCILFLACIVLLVSSTYNPFIYFRF